MNVCPPPWLVRHFFGIDRDERGNSEQVRYGAVVADGTAVASDEAEITI